MQKDSRTPFADLPAPQQAGILCHDPQFQRYAAMRCGAGQDAFSQSAAAEYIRSACNIASRRDLTTNTTARAQFEVLKTEFDAWRGRIATQR